MKIQNSGIMRINHTVMNLNLSSLWFTGNYYSNNMDEVYFREKLSPK